MHRIDGPGAVADLPAPRESTIAPGFFSPGNPATGQQSTRVTYEWTNAVQEELVNVITRAGLTLDKKQNNQLLEALKRLFLGADTVFTPYELCEFYFFRHPTLKAGFQPAHGGLLANAATLYPDAWAYLQTVEGQKLCKTEAQWQAMTTAVWATLADGTKVGWNGIGGAPYYVPNTATGALRLPDLRGMYAEAAGYDALSVGGTHGDGNRNVVGSFGISGAHVTTISGAIGATGSTVADAVSAHPLGTITFDASRVVPVAAKNQPRAWGTLACVYLGAPR